MVVMDGPPPGTTLLAWVKSALVRSIAAGEFDHDQPFITQRELVERFGVSTTTAVRVLNDLARDGVVVRRRGLGTFVARPGPATASRTVAFVSPDDVGPHQTALTAGLAAECAARGLTLVVDHSTGAADEEGVLRRVVAAGAGAVVLFAQEGSRAGPALAALARRGVAAVLVDRHLPEHPGDAVLFDDDAVGHAVTRAVLARGHTALAALWSETGVTSVADRLSGHRRALREAGVPVSPERSALRTYAGLPPAARRARLEALLTSPEGLTAVVCGNAPTMALVADDLMAFESGFPGAVELASMDEYGPYDVSPLAIASATLPVREMGVAAVRLLAERLSDPSTPWHHVVLPARVHVAPRRRGTLVLRAAGPAHVARA